MMKQNAQKPEATHQSDFAPALDPDPVFERPGEGRWEIGQQPEPFTAFLPNAAGSWADTRSAFDIDSAPGPGFLDPGTHALLNHVAPMMAAESFHAGALSGASTDLVASAPTYGGDGDGDDDDQPSKRKPPSR